MTTEDQANALLQATRECSVCDGYGSVEKVDRPSRLCGGCGGTGQVFEGSHRERSLASALLEKHHALEEACQLLKAIAELPYEDFNWKDASDDTPIHGWNNHTIYVGDVRAARAFLARQGATA